MTKNRTGAAAHRTKSYSPHVERSCEGPRRASLLHLSPGLGGRVSTSAQVFLPPWKLLFPVYNMGNTNALLHALLLMCYPALLTQPLPSHHCPAWPWPLACLLLTCFMRLLPCLSQPRCSRQSQVARGGTTNTRHPHSACPSHCSAPQAKKSVLWLQTRDELLG